LANRVAGIRISSEGLWEIRSSLDPSEVLERHVEAVLALLSGRQSNLSLLRQSDHSIDMFCGIIGADSNVTVSMEPAVLGALGELGISIVFDTYFAPPSG